MKRFLTLLFLLFPTLAFAQSAATPIINQTDIGPGDCSGTITTGGTAQNAFAAARTRHGFQITNIDTSEPMWISFTGTATANTQGSYPLAAATVTTFVGAGAYYSSVGFNTALSIIAATTGHKFSCTVW